MRKLPSRVGLSSSSSEWLPEIGRFPAGLGSRVVALPFQPALKQTRRSWTARPSSAGRRTAGRISTPTRRPLDVKPRTQPTEISTRHRQPLITESDAEINEELHAMQRNATQWSATRYSLRYKIDDPTLC